MGHGLLWSAEECYFEICLTASSVVLKISFSIMPKDKTGDDKELGMALCWERL